MNEFSIRNIYGLGLYYENICIARTKKDIKDLKKKIEEFAKSMTGEGK